MNKKLVSQKKRSVLTAGVLLFLSVFSVSQIQPFLKLSVKDYPDFSRLIIESSFPLSFDIEKSASFLLIKIGTDEPFRIQREAFDSRLIKSFGWSKGRDYYILTIKTKPRNFSYDYFTLDDPQKLVINIRQLGEERSEARPSLRGIEALKRKITPPTRSPALSRRKSPSSSFRGIKTIVIDPGHGGLEPGAVGKFGTLEKDITLAISLKLKAIIERNLALRVILTRDRDVNVSLENRAALANNNKAELFISIHTNSSFRKGDHGSETFFLSLKATDEEARMLAYMENNPAEFGEGIIGEQEGEITMILWDLAQSAYLKQSSRLAESIQRELNLLLRIRNRGIKQAPFKVLSGVACPAVLIEVAFISNAREERALLREDFQNGIAQAIYEGLVNYIKRYSQE